MLSYLFTSVAKDMNSERSRTNPASGKSWTWTRDRRIASPTRWQLGHAATNWSVRKWYSWINSGDRCNIWNIIDTSTILSTQGWINSIATSHSKMGSVFKVWTKPRWKRRQRGWNWHTFQPTSLPPTMVRIIILKTDTSRVIIKYRPTKTTPKYFLPENCHLNGPI